MSPQPEPIAIVGVGCRFPDAAGPAGFWELLDGGRDAIGPASPYRDGTASAADERPRGTLGDVERFDWRAFRISPRESTYIDPQQRLLLETAWEAFEHAGLPLDSVAGARAGVFVGIMWPDFAKMLAAQPSRLSGYAAAGAGFALAANRLSYQFDLRGPSVSLDVQCASSLTAVHLACSSLWAGECDLALAGGVNLILTADSDVMMSRAGILSPNGRVRVFDAEADGFVRGEGVGLVVLKPLAQARADGDRVLATILGSAVNHDGRRAPLTTPSHESQVELISAACARAGVSPSELGYVELHGTGTRRGDPLEAHALASVRGPGADRCLVGSVKSNIGHCEAAAGIASVIKVALALHHGRIPATLHHERPNPEIPLDELGLKVVTESLPWPRRDGRPALAGVTGLSLGGGNAHVVLAAAERPARRARGPRRNQVLPLSAKTRPALAALALAYADALEVHQLCDLAHTAALRRSHHEWRLAVVGDSPAALAAELRAAAGGLVDERRLGARPPLREDLKLGIADASSAALWAELAAVPEVPVVRGDGDVTLAANPDGEDLLRAVAELYVLGCRVCWERVVPDGDLIAAPTYRWAGEHLWLQPPLAVVA